MRKTSVIVAVCGAILALQTGAQAAWTLADGYYWESYNGKYYTLTQTGNEATWDQVRQEALALGGDLVVIDDAAENSWLASTMFDSPDYQNLPGYGGIEHLWIGFYQDPQGAEPAGGWTWVDGSPVAYTNWGENEPSDGGEVEDWAALRRDASSTWNDYHPTVHLQYDLPYDGIQGIVERSTLPVVPAPGAALLVALGSACVGVIRRRSIR